MILSSSTATISFLRLGRRLYKQNSKITLIDYVNSKHRHRHYRLHSLSHHHYPTISHPSNSTTLISLYPTYLTLFHISLSTPTISPIQLYPTLPTPPHFTSLTLLYPIYSVLPHLYRTTTLIQIYHVEYTNVSKNYKRE